MKKYVGYFLVLIGLIIMLTVLYRNSIYSRRVNTFSPYTFLTSSWENYKLKYMYAEGRVVDHSQNDITTSEGQSYAMLRSVWIDDPDEFDKVWTWTKLTLKRPNDNLFGWKWGKRKDNKFGFLEDGGENPASDADSDIALALTLASVHWNKPEYKSQAVLILKDLWDKETAVVNNNRYMIAGNWASDSGEIIINPSYFSPYALRVFAEYDKKHDWNSMIAPGYKLLNESSFEQLDKDKAIGLPPDWVAIDRKTGNVKATGIPNLSTNYSYDAMRVPFRIALDNSWYKSQESKDYLNKLCRTLSDLYNRDKKLASVYSHNGEIINAQESPAMYGAVTGCTTIGNSKVFQSIYNEKVVKLYSNTHNSFDQSLSYYDQNWLWFGAALYNNQITKIVK